MIVGGKQQIIFENKLKLLIENSNRILDIGTSSRFAKELKRYEKLFDGKEYIAAGYEPKLNYGKYNCDVHADIEDIPFDDEYFDSVICLEVIEHVKDPSKAAFELFRVLKQGGYLLLTTPFLLGFHGKSKKITKHDHDSYPDFWRFTHEGLELLFNRFSSVKIEALNGPLEVVITTLNCAKYLRNPVFRNIVDKLDKIKVGAQTTRHILLAKK